MTFHYTNMKGGSSSSLDEEKIKEIAIEAAKQQAVNTLSTNTVVQETISSAVTEKVDSIDNIATVEVNAETGASEGKFSDSTLDSNYDNINNYSSKESFPETGKKDTIYIDNSTGITYFWNTDTGEYMDTSGESLSDDEIASLFN